MSSAVFGGLVALLVLVILRKRQARHPLSVEQSRLFAELHAKYRKRDIYALLAYVAFAITLGSGWYLGLRWLAAWHASSLGPSRFLLGPSQDFWMLPAIFLGLVSGAVPLHYFLKALLRERLSEYELYDNLRARASGIQSGAFFWLAAPIIVVCVVAVVLNLNCYTQFTDREIVIKVPWVVAERRYSYGQVEEIASVTRLTTMSGNVVLQPHHAIRFNDGTVWTTKNGWWIADADHGRHIAEFVAEASGKRIKEIESIKDLGRGERR
jgi:hypothetical protein